MNDLRAVLKVRKLGDRALAIRSLEINGQRLDVPADSPITFRAGPGPTTLTVELVIHELIIEEDEE